METILFYGIGIIILFGLAKFLTFPLKVVKELVVNAILGGLALLLINFIGGFLGINIVITPLNAILVGFLGVPGVVILLVIQML